VLKHRQLPPRQVAWCPTRRHASLPETHDEFAVKWDQAYPTISQMWRRNWEHLTPFFAYPADIRKVIYTTNVIPNGVPRRRTADAELMIYRQ
jgi:transposase-like protein